MPITTQSPISLTILRRGNMLLVDVAELGSLIPRSETQVDDAFLQELAAEVSQLATPGYGRSRAPLQTAPPGREPERVVQELQRIGGVIFSHLFTEPVRTRLRTAEPCPLYLRLDEQLIQVPWELGFDGEHFLATKFRIGRQVITGYPLPRQNPTRAVEGQLKVLLIADPTESLPQASREVEQLCTLLGDIAGVKVTLWGGKNIRKLPLLAALQEYEVVHFAGHSEYDPAAPHKSGWRLHEGMLTAAEVSKLTRPPLLVFSNSCQAGTTAAWAGGYRYEGQAFGIGSAFLLAGVQNYIGTFWVVHDAESVGFAVSFYRSLAAGQTLGASLQQARQATLTQSQGQGLTWASYMLYGNPTTSLLHEHHAPPLLELSSVEPARVTSPGSALTQPQTEDRNEQSSVAAGLAKMPRKLVAILSADVAGYSRLMGEDEEATIRTLAAYHGVMRTLIQQHRGRVVDAPGDNMLTEFASVVDAVRSATEIQRELHTRNAELPSHRQMALRMGINLGDVIVEGEKLYGDGVNIAARLEALAEPGGICISEAVYTQVRNKLALVYEYIGEKQVKNIAEPVRAYKVRMELSSAAIQATGQEQSAQHPAVEKPMARHWRRAVLTVTVLLAVGAGGLVFRPLYTPFSLPSSITPEKEAPSLPLPDKPSIVVLPFTNMSGDPQQEYFSDGITEDITTDLSRISSLFVIARNSAFTYKGKAVNVAEIKRELGVRYILEGSVRRAENRVRINAQLIDSTTGHHLWAERYDRLLTDIFAVQDELTRKIVGTLQGQLVLWEKGFPVRKRTNNLEAYDSFLRGMAYHSRYTEETNVQAREMFARASDLDPQYGDAYAWLGWTYWMDWTWQWNQDPQNQKRAFEFAQQAITQDDTLSQAHQLLSNIYLRNKQYDRAMIEVERAIALDPNDPEAYATQADILNWTGRPGKAVELLEKAMRHNPAYPVWYLFELGWAYRLIGRLSEAIAIQKQVLSRNPDYLFAHTELALSYVLAWGWQLSREPETLERALEVAQHAIALSDSLWPHTVLSYVYLVNKEYDRAIAEVEKVVALDLTAVHGYLGLARLMDCVGKSQKAIEFAEKAKQLDPHEPYGSYLLQFGRSYVLTGRYEEATTALKEFILRNPNFLEAHLFLTIAYSELDHVGEAQAEVEEILRISPNFSLEGLRQRAPYKDLAVVERMVASLRKAGLK